MHASPDTSSGFHASSFSDPLDPYATDDLAEPSPHQLAETLDSEHSATWRERLAMAAFFGDALREDGPDTFDWPDPDEMDDLLDAMRHT